MKKLLIGIIIIVILVGLGIGIYFWLAGQEESTNKNQNTNQAAANTNATTTTTTTNRIKGESDGTSPYAPIDKENVASEVIGTTGRVIETDLSGNIKAYLNIPDLLLGATVTVLPYTKMPSTPQHPALSDELGYGLEVSSDSIEMGTTYYLVFDLQSGGAQEKVAESQKVYNRCDPARTNFDPLLCARSNGVSINKINKNYGVASPIFNEDNSLFVQPTFSIGVDGLLVTEISRTGVYIPQKLDQDLAQDLIDSTLVDYMNYEERQEAALLALEWNLTDSLTYQQFDNMTSAFQGDTYPYMIRGIAGADAYTDIVTSRLSQATDEDEQEDWEYILEILEEDYLANIDNLIGDAEFDTSGNYLERDYAVTGVVAVEELEDMDIPDAEEAAQQIEDNLGLGGGGTGSSRTDIDSLLGEAEAAQMMGDEAAAEQAMENLKDRARDKINETLNDPNASVSDLIKALELAQLLGIEDEFEDEIMDKIKEKLEEQINDPDATKRELLNLAGICQLLGFDDLANQAIEKAATAPDPVCDELIKKTLKNFGIQECL